MSNKESRSNRVTVVMGSRLKGKTQSYADEAERSLSDFIRLVLRDYDEMRQEQEQSEPVVELA